MKKIFALAIALCLCFSGSVRAEDIQAELLKATEGFELSKTGFYNSMIFGLFNFVIDLPNNQISKEMKQDGSVEFVFQPYGPYELNGQVVVTGEKEEPLITVTTYGDHLYLQPASDGSYWTVDEGEKVVFKDGVLPEKNVAETLTLNDVKVRCIHPLYPEGYEDMNYLLCWLIIIPENSSKHNVYLLSIQAKSASVPAIAVCKHIVTSLSPYGASSTDAPN